MNIQNLLINSPYWIRQIGVNAYGFLLARKRFSGTFETYLKEYQNNLSKSDEEIKSEQFRLLKDNLIYCCEHIPYYKSIFTDNAFNPYKMESFEEIQKIPFLTKEIIRSEFDNLYNKDISKSKYQEHFTSGSTGEKLRFFIPNELGKKNTAMMYRFYGLTGVKPKDKRVTIGGRYFANRKPYYSYNYFENQLLLSSHHLTQENIIEYLKEMNKYQPVFIQGHPSAILIISKFVLDENYPMNLTLKAIFTTGETLIEDDKKTIEKAFNTNVYQQYGSGENCFSAQELPGEDGYLLNYEHGYVELVGNDEYKEVVVTSFLNDVMPFVRYKIGDFVLPSKVKFSEKYGLPIQFKKVIGRIDDVIEDSKGKSILPVTIRMKMKPYLLTGTNYQLIQKLDKTFLLNLLDLKKELNSEKVIQMLKNILGEESIIEINYVESLTTKGGKIRNVICENK